jgi:hypothetical protein
MKTFNILFCFYILIFSTSIILSVYAQVNYINAIHDARHTDRTDASIERAMYRHGFIVDAYNTNEPTTGEKVKALFNKPSI